MTSGLISRILKALPPLFGVHVHNFEDPCSSNCGHLKFGPFRMVFPPQTPARSLISISFMGVSLVGPGGNCRPGARVSPTGYALESTRQQHQIRHLAAPRRY